MRHRKYTFKIGRTSAHRRSLLANATCSLIEHGRITTTLTKAKEIRRVADKMVTLGKDGSLHARRLAIAELRQVDKVRKLFSEIAPQFKERQGGYTRLMKLGPRIGDGAEMCIVEFVENDEMAKNLRKAKAGAEKAAVAENAPVASAVEVADEPAVEAEAAPAANDDAEAAAPAEEPAEEPAEDGKAEDSTDN